MNGFILFSVVATALARPDIGTPYNYKPPSTSYGTPFGESFHSASGNNGPLFQGAVSGPSAPSGFYPGQSNSNVNPNFQYNQQITGSGDHSQSLLNSGYHSTGFSNQGGQYNIAGTADGAGFGPQSNDVFKHVYFYDSPGDEETIAGPRINFEGRASGQTHYKVIFIKAPSYKQQPPQIIGNIGGGGGEKTLIYVLAKKPEPQQDIVINAQAAGGKVSKPEVYFIKYNTKQEAEQKISSTLNGQVGGGAPAVSVDSDHEFVGSIRDSIDVRSQGPIIKNLGGGGGGYNDVASGGATVLGFTTHNTGSGSSGQTSSVSQSNEGYGFSTAAPQVHTSGDHQSGNFNNVHVESQTGYP